MDDPQRFLPLSPHQFHILLALTDRDRHGYALIQDIAQRTDGALRLGTGTLYTAIARLVELGLIADAGRPPSKEDERRRYYRLMPLGRAVLQGRNGAARGARASRARNGSAADRRSRVREAIVSGVPRTVRIARAVHRWLLVLVPRAVRHTYREEMIATFETASAEASARGRTAVWRAAGPGD